MQTKETSAPAAPAASRGQRYSKSHLIGLAILVFMAGAIFGIYGNRFLARTGLVTQASLTSAEQFREIRSILQSSFNGDLDPQKQEEGALKGYVSSLGDPYTTFLSAEEAKELSDDLRGELSGIGIEVGIKNNLLTVIAPIDDTPAAKAGLKSGDVIARIDDKDASELTLDEAVKQIRGQAGTEVKLIVVSQSAAPREVKIIRERIQVSSVKTEIKNGDVGYIRLRRFGDDTDAAIQAAAADFASKGITKIVLDLRDNPGGYLDSAVTVSSEFVSRGTIVEERGKHIDSKKLMATPGGKLTNAKVVILINGGSASASEIVAGAVKDNNRATLVGEKTYGKGSVQEVKNLGSGAQLKVTVAGWYTPNGVNISKEGIKPDVAVELTNEDANAGRDPQLDKALEIVRQ